MPMNAYEAVGTADVCIAAFVPLKYSWLSNRGTSERTPTVDAHSPALRALDPHLRRRWRDVRRTNGDWEPCHER
ncbi:hypothetical protein BDW22DRAFT_1357831 [Trametopsis cervina]|nr:hypothetical protein BDW22DRAFT_1357831 [Trametopsis cervina]